MIYISESFKNCERYRLINLAQFIKWPQIFFYFFIFLLQKVKHNDTVIINKKSKIMAIVKNFREEIALYGLKDREKLIKCSEKSIKFLEEIADDKNENNIKYLDFEKNNYLKKNINPVSEEIEPITHNSAFLKTPTWLGPKNCTINPQSDDKKCFQYLELIFSI